MFVECIIVWYISNPVVDCFNTDRLKAQWYSMLTYSHMLLKYMCFMHIYVCIECSKDEMRPYRSSHAGGWGMCVACTSFYFYDADSTHCAQPHLFQLYWGQHVSHKGITFVDCHRVVNVNTPPNMSCLICVLPVRSLSQSCGTGLAMLGVNGRMVPQPTRATWSSWKERGRASRLSMIHRLPRRLLQRSSSFHKGSLSNWHLVPRSK